MFLLVVVTKSAKFKYKPVFCKQSGYVESNSRTINICVRQFWVFGIISPGTTTNYKLKCVKEFQKHPVCDSTMNQAIHWRNSYLVRFQFNKK